MQSKLARYAGIASLFLLYNACTGPKLAHQQENRSVPAAYGLSKDSLNTAKTKWKDFFTDPNLRTLIDTALKNNQDLNVTLQNIQIARNEILARKGAYLPVIGLDAGAGLEKSGRYTRNGAVDATTNIMPGKPMPDPLSNFVLAANVSWEVDIWKKLRNAKKSAAARYLSSIEGKNFIITTLVADIANNYYELLALDNQLNLVNQNIDIQSDALEIVKLQKQSAKVTELAVRRFEAQLLHTKSLRYDIQQNIVEAENRINFLLARFPQAVQRSTKDFSTLRPDTVYAGIPSQLLQNRPDIRQAEYELAASKLDVKVARAFFYPSLNITAGAGYQAFNPAYLFTTPQSLIYSIAGDLMAPLINRNAIKAAYYSASSRQVQAVYNYERTILNAYIEVANQLSNISNLSKSYELKAQQVQALTESTTIAASLFKSARADYMEVLLTQRDALDSKFELIETKKEQMNAMVNIYQALGGGWQ